MNGTQEEWRPVEGYDGDYEVSNLGRVRSLKHWNPRHLALCANTNGYHFVSLSHHGQKRPLKVHALVSRAFLGPRPDGLVICHNNDIKTDNRASNLRYDTLASNSQDAIKHGKNARMRITHCKRGHPLSGENVLSYPARPNQRICKACRTERKRKETP